MTRSVLSTRMPTSWAVCCQGLALCLVVSGLAGCSLGVMAGKAIFGDPKTPSEFRSRTGVDLTKSDKTLLVIVQTPQAIEAERPSLDMDLIEAMSKRLKLHGVQVVNPDRVAQWIDSNGGRFDHPTELAQEFEADFIAVINLESFAFHDANSPNLYHGQANGEVQVFEVQTVADTKQAQQIFSGSFRNQYPPNGPVAVDQLSPRMFQQRFIDNLADRLGSRFYDYRISDEM